MTPRGWQLGSCSYWYKTVINQGFVIVFRIFQEIVCAILHMAPWRSILALMMAAAIWITVSSCALPARVDLYVVWHKEFANCEEDVRTDCRRESERASGERQGKMSQHSAKGLWSRCSNLCAWFTRRHVQSRATPERSITKRKQATELFIAASGPTVPVRVAFTLSCSGHRSNGPDGSTSFRHFLSRGSLRSKNDCQEPDVPVLLAWHWSPRTPKP